MFSLSYPFQSNFIYFCLLYCISFDRPFFLFAFSIEFLSNWLAFSLSFLYVVFLSAKLNYFFPCNPLCFTLSFPSRSSFISFVLNFIFEPTYSSERLFNKLSTISSYFSVYFLPTLSSSALAIALTVLPSSNLSFLFGCVPTPRCPGWPDWANFRPSGDCLLWSIFRKLKK
jgi:hypothetical protein